MEKIKLTGELPEKWKLRVTNVSDIKEYLIAKYDKVDDWITRVGRDFFLYSDTPFSSAPRYVSCCDRDGYTRITLDQFNKYVFNPAKSEVESSKTPKFKVPENWYIKGGEDFNSWLQSTGRFSRANIHGGLTTYCYYNPKNNYINWDCLEMPSMPGMTEITFEEFIDYIYNKQKTNKMREEEFSIGGSRALKEAFAKEVGVSLYSEGSLDFDYLTPDESGKLRGTGGMRTPHFELPAEWDDAVEYVLEALERVEEEELEETVLYFGELRCSIYEGNDFAVTDYGEITKEEVEAAIKPFETELKICGHNMEIDDVDSIKLKFGCQSGTIGEAKALLEAFTN